MRIHPYQLLLLLALVPIPGSVGRLEAQTIPSSYRFIDTRHDAGFLVGTLFEERGKLRLGPGGGTLFGGRYGFVVTGPAAVEVSAYLISSDREVYDPQASGGPALLGETSSLIAGIDGRLRFTLTGARSWRGFGPFLLVGGGLASDLKGASELEDDFVPEDRFTFGPSLMGILGAGTQWFIGDRITLRAEGVLHYWKLGTPSTYRTLEAIIGPVPEDEWVAAGSVVLGGSFRF